LSGILTIGGFAFSLLASVSEPAARLCAPALYTIAHIFLAIITWFAHLPYASITLPV
jgi:hypothetical protein